jgi:ribosomal protein L28
LLVARNTIQRDKPWKPNPTRRSIIERGGLFVKIHVSAKKLKIYFSAENQKECVPTQQADQPASQPATSG